MTPLATDFTEKELDTARVLEEFKAGRKTGTVTLHFKDGRLMSGTKLETF